MADNFYATYPVSGGGGVSSLNGLTGALTLVGAGGITITPSGTNITITGTGGTVTSFSFTNGGGFTGTVTNPTTTPALSLVGTLTGDITGSLTATHITATTNSTLTTLSALSLPYSQLTGTPTFANQSLSNLTNPTSINQDLLSNGTSTVGESGTPWPTIYATNYDVNSSGLMWGQFQYDGVLGINVSANFPGNSGNAGGDLSLFTALNTNTSFPLGTGNINISTGNNATPGATTGSITVKLGVPTAGTAGTFNIKDSSLGGSSVGYVWTLLNTTTGAGSWQATNAAVGTPTAPVANAYIDDLHITAGGSVDEGLLSPSGLDFNIQAAFPGNSGNPGGNLNLFTSNYTAGVNAGNGAGSVSITAGNSNGAGSGSVNITSGNNSAGSPGGNIIMSAGTGSTQGFVQISALYLQLPRQSADPTAPIGSVYFNTTTNKIKVFNGTTWETVTSV